MSTKPQVSIVMGSDSDLEIMQEAAKALGEFGIEYEMDVTSAHRSPERTAEYARKAGNERVHRAIDRYCKSLQNPRAGYIADLIGSFDASWRDELETFWGGRIKDLIDSIAANRNNIAHGRSVGVSMSRLSDFYAAYVDVVKFLDGLILGAGHKQ